jgi:hypothetical protein
MEEKEENGKRRSRGRRRKDIMHGLLTRYLTLYFLSSFQPPRSFFSPLAMARNTPLILIALIFFSLSLYLLFTSPSSDPPSSESIESPPFQHPCPYADILGLDENSINPHGAGGNLPPVMGGGGGQGRKEEEEKEELLQQRQNDARKAEL